MEDVQTLTCYISDTWRCHHGWQWIRKLWKMFYLECWKMTFHHSLTFFLSYLSEVSIIFKCCLNLSLADLAAWGWLSLVTTQHNQHFVNLHYYFPWEKSVSLKVWFHFLLPLIQTRKININTGTFIICIFLIIILSNVSASL